MISPNRLLPCQSHFKNTNTAQELIHSFTHTRTRAGAFTLSHACAPHGPQMDSTFDLWVSICINTNRAASWFYPPVSARVCVCVCLKCCMYFASEICLGCSFFFFFYISYIRWKMNKYMMKLNVMQYNTAPWYDMVWCNVIAQNTIWCSSLCDTVQYNLITDL